MKKVIIGIAAAVVVAVVLLAVFGVIGGGGFAIVGSGDLTSKNFDLSDFTEIVARSGFQLEIAQSSTFSVEVTADDNAMDYINVSKSGNTLRIGPQWNRSFRSVTLRAKITMPDLHEIKLSGGSQASISGFSSSHDLSVGLSGGSGVTGDITAGDAYFDLSGGSQVNLQGTAEDLDINGSGGSQLDLEAFSVNNADVSLSGGGRATINLSGILDVNLSGGSRVTYIGEPTLGDINLSGDSTVSKDDEATTRAALQASLEAAVDSPDTVFPGATLCVSGPELGTWTGASGLRNIGTNSTAQPNDKFRGGSIMKPFVSVVILQLIEEGLLSLDDPMTNVLPASVTGKFANSSNITVRMLLNHTAGIPEWLGEAQINEIAANPAKIWEVEEYIDLAAGQEPYFDPGEGIYYSNTDYNLLGLVIEQAAGRAWREEVRERIIEELNLENTLLPEPGEIFIPDDHIRGYHPMGEQLIDLTGIDPSMAGAAGGHALVTTATDLTAFLDAVLAGELFQNPETLEEMLTFEEADPYGMPVIPGIEWDYYGYRLGLEKWVLSSGVELIGHAGTTAGFSATVYYLTAQDTTIALAFNIQDLLELFTRMILPTVDILTP